MFDSLTVNTTSKCTLQIPLLLLPRLLRQELLFLVQAKTLGHEYHVTRVIVVTATDGSCMYSTGET